MPAALCKTPNSPPCYNGVLTYVPDTCGISAWQANTASADAFTPTETSYYLDQISSMVPGIVLGAVSLVGFIMMLIWICVRCCRRRKLNKAAPSTEAEQFLTSEEKTSSTPNTPLQRVGRRGKASDLLTGVMVLVGLTVIGISGWGMAESIKATDTVIVNFWDIVDQIQNLTTYASHQFQHMSYSLVQVDYGLRTIANDSAALEPALLDLASRVGVDPQVVQGVFATAQQEAQGEALINLATTINTTSTAILNEDIGEAILDVIDFQDPTMSIQDTWRYVVFAVLFGLIILFVAVATAVCFWMRFGRWASLFVALIWLLSAIINLLGLGLMNGIKSVANDACLYTETFLYRDVVTKIGDDNVQRLINAGMDYYFNVTSIQGAAGAALENYVDGWNPQVSAALLQKLTGQNWTQALEWVQRVVMTLDAFLKSPEFDAVLSKLPDQTESAIRSLYLGAEGLLASTTNLVRALLRSNVTPLYHALKGYICCDIYGSAHNVWVPWVVTGVLLIVYCLLASARIVWQTFVPEDRGWVALGGMSTRRLNASQGSALGRPAAAAEQPPAGVSMERSSAAPGPEHGFCARELEKEGTVGRAPAGAYVS